MAVIEAKDVTYAYTSEDDVSPALWNVTLSIEPGEFVAIVGHNGSGKSTLAKLLNGLYTPASGHVVVKGMDTQDERHVWDIRRTVGMVFQNPDNQLVATVVEEDVAFGPENLGVPPAEIRQRVDEALEQVNMSAFKDHAPHMLSGGQKQRVAIAGVLAMHPEIIVFDEPTAMLDPEGREEVLAAIRDLNGKGKTIVLITHYMEEALLADRVVVMTGGQITATGTPREIFADETVLKEAGLTAPPHIELYHRLKNKGYDLGECPLTVDELVDKLCR
ncbi:MAG: energy-coupling factor transporter ATPase [Christensenellaceae bacterium]|nr:energy-coupling factor transporter ATPase [Christensenellaceae bacterium]